MISCQVFSQTKTDFKPYKTMSHEQFLMKAYENDSLKAVVNMFFRKRKEAATGYCNR